MAMNYKEVDAGTDAERYAQGISLVHNFVDSLQRERLLPERFSGVAKAQATRTEEKPKPHGLEPIRFAIEIPAVSKEVYMRTREALEAVGHTFVTAIRSVSIEDLLAEDRQRKQVRFGYVNDSKTMRATVPPEMEVVVNPDRVRIEGSNRLPTDEQKAKIKTEEAELKEQLPKDLRDLVSMHMVDPSTYSQLEDAYIDKEGKLLFPDYFARTDV